MRRKTTCNDLGYRVGEHHHNARLSDGDVDLILELRDRFELSYAEIAWKFEVSKSTVRDICTGRTRWQRPTRVAKR